MYGDCCFLSILFVLKRTGHNQQGPSIFVLLLFVAVQPAPDALLAHERMLLRCHFCCSSCRLTHQTSSAGPGDAAAVAASAAAARYVAASGSGIPEGLSLGGLTNSTGAGGSNGTAAAAATAAAVAASAAAARYAAATIPVTPGDRLKPLSAPYVQLMQSKLGGCSAV